MYNQNQNQNFQHRNYQQSNYQQPKNQYQNNTYQTNQQQNNHVQIKNPATSHTSKTKGPEMTDRDRINDMLTTEKFLTNNFNTFALETSYSELHQDVCQILKDTHQEARNLFKTMFNQGWYSLQSETTQQVADTQQQFSNYQSQFANSLNNQQISNSTKHNSPYQNQMF